MKFQLVICICLFFPFTNLAKLFECKDYRFRCPWDFDSFKIYTKWSWKKGRCVMSTTQNVNKRMKEKCGNLGTCDNSTTWYEDVGMGCSVPEKIVRYQVKVGKIAFTVGQLTNIDEYSVLFNDECVMHDICYRSGNNQSRCDDEFEYNMLSMCKYTLWSPQTRYKVPLPFIDCGLWAKIFAGAVRGGGESAWKRGQDFHKEHGCSSDIGPLTDEESIKELIYQQKRELESYNKNNDNPNNEPMAVLNDMEWKMNILIAFVGGIVVLLCCITFYQYCTKEKSIKYSKVASYNTDSDADVLVNVK